MTTINIFQTFNALLQISRVFGLSYISLQRNENNYFFKLRIIDFLILTLYLVLYFILSVLAWMEFYLFLNCQNFSPSEILRLSIHAINSVGPFFSMFSMFRNQEVIFKVLKTLNKICGEFDNLNVKYNLYLIKKYYIVLILFRFTITIIVHFIVFMKFSKGLLLPIIHTMFQSANAGFGECQFITFVYVLYVFLKSLNQNYDRKNIKTFANIHFTLFSLHNKLNRAYDFIIWNIFTIFTILSYINYRTVTMLVYEEFNFLNVFRYVIWGLCQLSGLLLMVINCQLVQEEVSKNNILSFKLFYTFLILH